MKKFLILVAFTLVLFVLQTSFLPLFAVHGVSPDLLLLLTVSFGFLRGVREGALMGFAVGLLQDLATGTFLGVNAFTRLLIGLVCGSFSERVFKEQFFLPIMASVAATAANYFVLALFMLLLGYRFSLVQSIGYTLIPMLIYQLAFAYPIHRLAYDLDKKLSEKYDG